MCIKAYFLPYWTLTGSIITIVDFFTFVILEVELDFKMHIMSIENQITDYYFFSHQIMIKRSKNVSLHPRAQNSGNNNKYRE